VFGSAGGFSRRERRADGGGNGKDRCLGMGEGAATSFGRETRVQVRGVRAAPPCIEAFDGGGTNSLSAWGIIGAIISKDF